MSAKELFIESANQLSKPATVPTLGPILRIVYVFNKASLKRKILDSSISFVKLLNLNKGI